MSQPEQVGVIPTVLAQRLDLLALGFWTPQPASTGGDSLADILGQLEAAITFVDRTAAEKDPSFKQIIPYGLVTSESSIFVMERLSGGGEKRLFGKLSIGVGGHINPADVGAGSLNRSTLERELHEEISISGAYKISPRGFINDDRLPVGRVHLGVVYDVKLDSCATATVKEVSSLRGAFCDWASALARVERMESWSAFILHEMSLNGGSQAPHSRATGERAP